MASPKPPLTQYEPGFKKQLTREQRDPGEHEAGGGIYSGMNKRVVLTDGERFPSEPKQKRRKR